MNEFYECGEGWYDIIKPVVDYVNAHNESCEEKDKIEIVQIKEKFGALEIYAHNKNEEFIRLASEARSKSLETCEFCGSVEDVGQTTDGWIITCCKNCIQNLAKKQGRNRKWYSYKDKKRIEIDGKQLAINAADKLK